jgi:chromosome segregation ATPase
LVLIAEAPTPDAEVISLQETVSEAQPVHQALATRAAVWEQFVKERDNANTQLDNARRPLEVTEPKGLRTLPEAQQDLETLVNGQEQLSPLETTLDTLQRLSEQLDPLETAYADVRFFDVDLEQTREQYEDQLTALRNEIDDENALVDATHQVQNELARLAQHAQTDNKDVLVQLEQHELPALLAQSQLLLDRDQTARHERRIVQRPESPLVKELHDQLKQLAGEINKRINDINLAERQQVIEALRLEVELMKSEIPTEDAIERVALQLENLPKEDSDVVVLQKELAEVRAKKDQVDSLKRRLQDELAGVAEKLQRVEDATRPSDAEKPRKKKGKKQPTIELKPAERKERIESLSAAIDQLDNQIIPKLAEIQLESLNGGVEVPGLPPQQQKAAKLVETLNAELTEKEAEQAAIDAVLKDAELLRSVVESIDQQLQLPVTAILSLDEAKSELAHTSNNIDQLKAELRRVEDSQPHGLDQESLAQLKSSEELAKSELDKLTSRAKELETQAALIGQLEDKKNDAENQVNNLKAEVEAITDKYAHGPISLVSAEDDLRRSESTKNRLAEALAFLNNLKDWLSREMPNNEPAQQQLDEQKNGLDELSRRLDELRRPLVEEVAHQNQLLQKQAELEQQLTDLENQTLQASEPSAFEAIQASLLPVREQLGQLSQQVVQVPTNLVQHSDLLNLPAVDARIQHLEQVLAQAEDARKAEAEAMAIARLAGQIAQETKKIAECLNRVQHTSADPHSGAVELQDAIVLLDSANTQLGALEDLYNTLDPANDQQNAIRTEAVANQSALGEELGNLRQSLQDRLDALQRFNDNADEIEARLRKLVDDADAVQPEAGSSALEQLAALSNEEEKLGEAISHLASDLPALDPLQKPLTRHDELQRLHRNLNDQINNAKSGAEAAVQKQQAIDEYIANIQQLEEALRNLEREADSLPLTTEALKPLADAVAASLVEPIKQLEQAREAPTEELKERKSRLKEKINNLNQRVNDDYKMAQNQENLLDTINRDLERVNDHLNQLNAKYQDKRPLDEAVRDKITLEDLIIEQLSPLVASLNDVDDRNKRDEISRRIEEARSNVDTLLTPLSNEVRKDEELLKDWQSALEDFNRIGAEVLHIGASGDANAELAKATALLDELRPLQIKAEKLDARRLEPTHFTTLPIAGESLQERVAQLQDEVAKKRRALTDKIALDSVVPEIHLASEALQQRLDEFAAPSEPLPIETAENSIRELEEQKRRLETLLEKIPEGEAGDEIRNKTSWNLNSLKDLLNRLTETVGEKVKAIAAFLASKKEAENQLSQLHDQLNRIESEGPQSPEALRHTLENLSAEEARLNKLREQFEEEHRPENLDDDKRQELEALKRDIEAASEHLKTVRENIQQNIQRAIQLEKLHADLARANSDLVALTEVIQISIFMLIYVILRFPANLKKSETHGKMPAPLSPVQKVEGAISLGDIFVF